MDAAGQPERRGELLQRPPVALLAAPRRAGHERGHVVALAQRPGGQRANQHVLALPARDPAQHRHDRRALGQAKGAARRFAIRALRGERETVVEHEGRRRGAELPPGRLRDAGQRVGAEQQPPVGGKPALEARVDLAHVPNVWGARHARGGRAAERHRRVRVDERDLLARASRPSPPASAAHAAATRETPRGDISARRSTASGRSRTSRPASRRSLASGPASGSTTSGR